MARVKVKVDRGNGLQQTVVIDTAATEGATLGSNVFLNGAVATPAAVRTWLGVSTGSSTLSPASGRPLTTSDDTNITLTLGGAPGSALITAASIAAGWAGQLSAPRGGTGFGSYAAGDLLYASGASTLAKLGIGAAGELLRVSGGAPAWQSFSTLLANPSAQVGLTAVNGSALTAMRSDGAPALSQAISPTWTGAHVFAGQAVRNPAIAGLSLGLDSTNPAFVFSDPTAPANQKLWEFFGSLSSLGSFGIAAIDDAVTSFRMALQIDRAGHAIGAMLYGNPTDNPPHTFHGQLVPNGQSLSTGASVPSIGANKPGSAVSLTPSTWWAVVINGTQYYLPLWI